VRKSFVNAIFNCATASRWLEEPPLLPRIAFAQFEFFLRFGGGPDFLLPR
jgi:hypothetical protein